MIPKLLYIKTLEISSAIPNKYWSIYLSLKTELRPSVSTIITALFSTIKGSFHIYIPLVYGRVELPS